MEYNLNGNEEPIIMEEGRLMGKKRAHNQVNNSRSKEWGWRKELWEINFGDERIHALHNNSNNTNTKTNLTNSESLFLMAHNPHINITNDNEHRRYIEKGKTNEDGMYTMGLSKKQLLKKQNKLLQKGGKRRCGVDDIGGLVNYQLEWMPNIMEGEEGKGSCHDKELDYSYKREFTFGGDSLGSSDHSVDMNDGEVDWINPPISFSALAVQPENIRSGGEGEEEEEIDSQMDTFQFQ